jgi:putative SOS response-associated peptidase YedK
VETCTVIATSAGKVSAAIHDRMPVILNDAAIDRWLDRSRSMPRNC